MGSLRVKQQSRPSRACFRAGARVCMCVFRIAGHWGAAWGIWALRSYRWRVLPAWMLLHSACIPRASRLYMGHGCCWRLRMPHTRIMVINPTMINGGERVDLVFHFAGRCRVGEAWPRPPPWNVRAEQREGACGGEGRLACSYWPLFSDYAGTITGLLHTCSMCAIQSLQGMFTMCRCCCASGPGVSAGRAGCESSLVCCPAQLFCPKHAFPASPLVGGACAACEGLRRRWALVNAGAEVLSRAGGGHVWLHALPSGPDFLCGCTPAADKPCTTKW